MKRRIKKTTVDGRGIPPELLDVEHVVWHDRYEHAAYMDDHGWPLGVRDRIGPGAPPRARRQAAVIAWACEHGITDAPTGGHADLHRLRAMGLYP